MPIQRWDDERLDGLYQSLYYYYYYYYMTRQLESNGDDDDDDDKEYSEQDSILYCPWAQ